MSKKVPRVKTDKQAEAFLAHDLSKLDFSQFKPSQIEFDKKDEQMRESLETAEHKPTKRSAASCYDLASDLAGSVKGLPKDLAENPKCMKGFGE